MNNIYSLVDFVHVPLSAGLSAKVLGRPEAILAPVNLRQIPSDSREQPNAP